ncbi:hypothetical protein LXA47_06905 [Massilia sp. P8910]|uniref:hypothetical protein n=1 Tax=Massilia antarctica TaxID=2765360 RepID=UPI0006BB9711|nr:MULTISPECIES: hypothetical protein [Massilia]MCE3603336.1 hypothetical protein [Massilia antarctica]MCY0914475.1 hypothetical protein [Massilia sp. H27-R4]CUI03141.1 hypothetical protein BN2497_1059 [Janthinobacterium sp. CG23_2]CUU26927.1 hypothetical protein BN3177_1059 [Janthinobacterium sp. CG23_2]
MSITISNTTPSGGATPIAPRETGRRPTDSAQPEGTVKTDKVTLSGPEQAPLTYGVPRAAGAAAQAPPDLDALLAESDRQAQEVINLILPAVEQQGLNLSKVVSGEQKLSADPATIEEAKAATAEDGEFGVAKVSERILNMAKGAIGDDPSKLAAIRAAVQDGFDEAAKALGGTLPELSQKTQDAIMATFDRWEKDGMSAEPVKAANDPSGKA